MQPATRYHGGDGASMGRVHRLSQASWRALVQEVLGHPVPVNVTRAQFWSLSPEEQKKRKRVHFITPATFRSSPCDRRTDQADGISLLALDIDDPAQARPLVANLQLLATQLEPLNYALYHTASSTPKAPKLRLLVPATGLTVRQYPDAVRALAARLGLPSVTAESLVAVQPMYRPTAFAGEDPIVDHPLAASRVDGADFVPADLQPASTPTASRTPATADSALDDETMDNLRPPVEGFTLQDAEEALEHLDPDCSMIEWVETAAALKHQFQDKAYELFDSWSSKGIKYQGREETEARWRSLRPTPRGRAPVTIRSLIHRAVDGGWTRTGIGSKVHVALTGWLEADERTPAELLQQGVRRIAATPLLDQMATSSLLARLRARLKKMGHQVTISDLKKALRRAQKIEAPPKATEVPRWAQGVCYVAGENEFYFRNSKRTLGPEALDSVYGIKLMGEDDQHTGRPTIRPRDFLLNIANIPRVDHYLYDPSHPEEAFVQREQKRFVNLYLPTYPEPDANDADAAGEVFMRHVQNLIGEPEYRRTLVDFLAFLVQNPGVKIRWAVLLQGAEGCGKTALAETMAAVLGPTHVNMIDASMLFSQFNTWAHNSQLVAIEEIRLVGHNRHEVMDKLKPCISNETVTINAKHRDLKFNLPNVTNYLMFTNHRDSLAIGNGDRRYFVLNSAMQDKSQVLDLGPDYFAHLFGTIRHHGPGLRAFFEDWGISSKFNPNGHAPVTKYLHELRHAGASPLAAAIQEAILDADHPLIQKDLISSRALTAVLDSEGHRSLNAQSVAQILRELGYQNLGRARIGERRHWLWTRQTMPLDAAIELALQRANPDSINIL